MSSGTQDQFTAGQALAEIVVAVAAQFQCKSLGDKSTETLSAAALAMDDDKYPPAGYLHNAG